MFRFWLMLWARWALWLTLFSMLSALLLSVVATLGIYSLKGAPSLENDVTEALSEIGRFAFLISWSVMLLAAFFFSVRRLFGTCIDGYEMVLLGCDGKEEITRPGIADTAKVWRKWLFVIIWVVAAQVIAVAALHNLLLPGEGMMAWFSVYWLYLFILLAALATLPLMGSRCSQVRVRRC